MHSVGSAISAQNAKAKAEIKIVPTWKAAAHIIEIGLANGTYEGKRLASEELQRMADVADRCVELTNVGVYQLPHGFKIEPSNNSHTLTCNGYFVFTGSLNECFIAFGGHLEGVGK